MCLNACAFLVDESQLIYCFRFILGSNMFRSKGALTIQPFLTTLTSNCTMLTELVLKDAVRGSHTLATIGKSCNRLRILDLTGSVVSCADLVHLCMQSPPAVVSDITLVSMFLMLLITVCTFHLI